MPSIWVPIVGDGSDDNPYRPDVPPTVAWCTDDGLPVNLADEGRGVPLGRYASIIVADADVERCPQRVAEQDVPERDRLTVEMIRTCRDDYETKAGEFFDGIPGMASADAARRRAVKDVLVQAVLRGLSATRAEVIRQRLDLS